MEGMIEVSYTIMCKNDVNQEVSLETLLANEKMQRAIKSEFAKGIRNLVLSGTQESKIVLKTYKEIFTFRVEKNDYADILELAEEDAKSHKRFKKECDGVELVDMQTID